MSSWRTRSVRLFCSSLLLGLAWPGARAAGQARQPDEARARVLSVGLASYSAEDTGAPLVSLRWRGARFGFGISGRRWGEYDAVQADARRYFDFEVVGSSPFAGVMATWDPRDGVEQGAALLVGVEQDLFWRVAASVAGGLTIAGSEGRSSGPAFLSVTLDIGLLRNGPPQ